MDTLYVIAGIVAAIVVIIGGVVGLYALVTAGRGSFLKERNDELAAALEQMRAQRKDDREECQREISELRDQCNQLRGEVAAHRLEYAEAIAQLVAPKVIEELEHSGWVRGPDS